MSEKCPLCSVPNSKMIASNVMAYAVIDESPVTQGHLLIIPRRHVEDYFELSDYEKGACDDLLDKVREEIEENDASVAGFNVGINVGDVAGQTIPHAHVHLIPRRPGDVEDPSGGVRHLLDSKK